MLQCLCCRQGTRCTAHYVAASISLLQGLLRPAVAPPVALLPAVGQNPREILSPVLMGLAYLLQGSPKNQVRHCDLYSCVPWV